jgi:hypothetical protein
LADIIKQIQAAAQRGQVVVITLPTTARDNDATIVAALCRAFGLRRGEARMLAWLLAHGSATREELRAAAAHSLDVPATFNSMKVGMWSLRKKLRPHDIEINVTCTVGYSIDKTARNKIADQLRRHDPEIEIAASQRPKSHRDDSDFTPDAA